MVYNLIHRYQVQFYHWLFLPLCHHWQVHIHIQLRTCWNLNQRKGLVSGFSQSYGFHVYNTQKQCVFYAMWENTWTWSHLICTFTSLKNQLYAVVQKREKNKCWSTSWKHCREIASKYCSSFTISKCLFCSIFILLKYLISPPVICKNSFLISLVPFLGSLCIPMSVSYLVTCIVHCFAVTLTLRV